MADRKKYPEIWTPRGTAIFPKLHKPSFKFNKDGKFELQLQFAIGDVAALDKQLLEYTEEFKAWYIANKSKEDKVGTHKRWPAKSVFKPIYDKDGNDTGLVRTVLTMNAIRVFKEKDGSETRKAQAPKVFDGRGKPTKAEPYTGSILRGCFQPDPFIANDKEHFSVSMRLKAAQIIKLVGPTERDAASFGLEIAEDGFVDDGFEDNGEQQDTPPFNTDDNASSSASKAASDF